MGGGRAAGRFHTYPVFAMDDGRLRKAQMETGGAEPGGCDDVKSIASRPAQTPIVDPGEPAGVIESGFAKCTAAHLLGEVELAAGDIRDREVRELQIVDDETGRFRISLRRGPDAMTEE